MIGSQGVELGRVFRKKSTSGYFPTGKGSAPCREKAFQNSKSQSKQELQTAQEIQQTKANI